MLDSGDLTIMSKAVDVPDTKEPRPLRDISPLGVRRVTPERSRERVVSLLPAKPS